MISNDIYFNQIRELVYDKIGLPIYSYKLQPSGTTYCTCAVAEAAAVAKNPLDRVVLETIYSVLGLVNVRVFVEDTDMPYFSVVKILVWHSGGMIAMVYNRPKEHTDAFLRTNCANRHVSCSAVQNTVPNKQEAPSSSQSLFAEVHVSDLGIGMEAGVRDMENDTGVMLLERMLKADGLRAVIAQVSKSSLINIESFFRCPKKELVILEVSRTGSWLSPQIRSITDDAEQRIIHALREYLSTNGRAVVMFHRGAGSVRRVLIDVENYPTAYDMLIQVPVDGSDFIKDLNSLFDKEAERVKTRVKETCGYDVAVKVGIDDPHVSITGVTVRYGRGEMENIEPTVDNILLAHTLLETREFEELAVSHNNDGTKDIYLTSKENGVFCTISYTVAAVVTILPKQI